jgi:AraC family transcriptional regulator
MKVAPSPSAERVAQGRFATSRRAIGCAVGFAPALTSEVSGWRNLALFTWRGQCSEAQFEPLDETMIVYHVGGARTVSVRIGQRSSQRTHPGLITIIPPATRVCWGIGGEVHSHSLHLNSHFLGGAVGDTRSSSAQLRFRCGVQDPLIAHIIDSLEREIYAPSEIGSLFADSVADTLALHLLNKHAMDTPPISFRGGLSNKALRVSLDRLEAGIVEGVSLQELADAAQLSRTYFADAFRRAMGVAPHRYLTQRRLERARDLLRNSSLPICEIALQCGFSSQSHLSKTFLNTYGTSPRRYRVDAY